MARKTIRLTAKMADALGNTIGINGKQMMIMSHPKTQAALAARGLADEHGYLTDQGRFVAHLVSVGRDTPYYWTWDAIEAGTRTWLSDRARDAGTAVPAEVPRTIKRVVNGRLVEMPAHREAAAYIAETKPEPVTEYSVKIWYRSGAYEGDSHCPEELARKIFADAVKSSQVEAAELHGPSGKLVESKTPNEESPVTTEPEPQENLFLAGLPLLHPEPLPPAPELPHEPEPTA